MGGSAFHHQERGLCGRRDTRTPSHRWPRDVDAPRVPGRCPVGTIETEGVQHTIRPGQSLVIEDRMEPAEWMVR